MENQQQPGAPILDTETSLSKISAEFRREFCWLAMIGEDGTLPAPSQISQHARRNLVRAVFSFVEAMSYAMKANGLQKVRNRNPPWDVGDTLLAEEISIELNDAGKTVRRRAKLRTLSNVKFAFKFLSETYGADFALDLNTNGWQCLQKSIKVRDRLTHPKRLSDLWVGDDECKDAIRSFIWFDRQVIRILESLNSALEKEVGALTQEVRKVTPAARLTTTPRSRTEMPPRPQDLDDDV